LNSHLVQGIENQHLPRELTVADVHHGALKGRGLSPCEQVTPVLPVRRCCSSFKERL
jgi:hypothetical protein